MARKLLVALLTVGIVACSAAPKSKNELATSNDTKQKGSAQGEGDDSQTSPEPSGPTGSASAPQPDDDSSPPPRKDAGADASNPPPPPPPPPPDDGGAAEPMCYSATLMDYEPEGVCVQSSSTNLWYQCHDTMWYQGVVGDEGPYGPCTISYPLL